MGVFTGRRKPRRDVAFQATPTNGLAAWPGYALAGMRFVRGDNCMAGLRGVCGGIALALVAGACVHPPAQAPRTSADGHVGPVPLGAVARHIFAVEEPGRRGVDTVVLTVHPLS